MGWFAAKTKNKGEFKAMSFFNSIGINSYVPSYQTKRVWSDRIKKVTVPAISGYVFFEIPKMNYDLINLNPYTRSVVKNISGAPAIITDFEIATLKEHLGCGPSNNKSIFYEGQDVKVCSGPFIFKEGVVNKVGDNKIIIEIGSININLIVNKSSIVAA